MYPRGWIVYAEGLGKHWKRHTTAPTAPARTTASMRLSKHLM
jgi:hypothetical protein